MVDSFFSKIKKLNSSIKIALLTVFIILFNCILFSCSQNLPETKSVNSTVIFEYENEESYPVSRLSIFVEATSDVKRAETLEIVSTKTGFTWESSDLVKIANSKRKWAGYANFVVPEGLTLPDGNYEIKYINADGEKTSTKTYVSYDKKFLTTKASEIPELMAGKNGKMYIAVFNRDNKLLYYGEKGKELKDENSIMRKYKEAYYYREVWVNGGSSVMCLMPKELLKK